MTSSNRQVTLTPALQQAIESASAVYDIDTISHQPIKDQVVADRPVANLRGDVRTGTAETWILGKEDELAVDLFKESVRGVGVVLGDVDPDVDQIILCPGGATNDRHRAWLSLGSISLV